MFDPSVYLTMKLPFFLSLYNIVNKIIPNQKV